MGEHISRFLIQSGDASPVDALRIRLFRLSYPVRSLHLLGLAVVGLKMEIFLSYFPFV